MVAFTATSSPVLVNSYLLGDSGIVITVAPPSAPCSSAGWSRGATMGPDSMQTRLRPNRLR